MNRLIIYKSVLGKILCEGGFKVNLWLNLSLRMSQKKRGNIRRATLHGHLSLSPISLKTDEEEKCIFWTLNPLLNSLPNLRKIWSLNSFRIGQFQAPWLFKEPIKVLSNTKRISAVSSDNFTSHLKPQSTATMIRKP